jgi:phosphoribosylformylglycinamidine (FGAM) synthase PurS component
VTDIYALDAEIDELRRKMADATSRGRASPFTPEADALHEAQRRMSAREAELVKQRTLIEFGVEDQEQKLAPAKAVPSPTVKHPIVRITAGGYFDGLTEPSADEIAAEIRDLHETIERSDFDELDKARQKKFWEFAVENSWSMRRELFRRAVNIEGDTPKSITITTGLLNTIFRELAFHYLSDMWQTNRIDQLEERLKTLEARPASGVDYKDVWAADQPYEKNDIVTHGGSAWIAKSPSLGQIPGKSAGFWKLMVKRGADGKDAK